MRNWVGEGSVQARLDEILVLHRQREDSENSKEETTY